MIKDERLLVRLPSELKKKLQKEAKGAGLKLSDLVRIKLASVTVVGAKNSIDAVVVGNGHAQLSIVDGHVTFVPDSDIQVKPVPDAERAGGQMSFVLDDTPVTADRLEFRNGGVREVRDGQGRPVKIGEVVEKGKKRKRNVRVIEAGDNPK